MAAEPTSPRSPEPEQSGPEFPGPESPESGPAPLISTLALRVFSFFLAALLGISFGASALVSLAQWLDVGALNPAAVQRIFQGEEEVDPVLGLWLRAGTLPLILWIAWFFIVKFDSASPSTIGLRRPRTAGTEALLGCLAAALTLMVWFMSITPMVSSRVAQWNLEQPLTSVDIPLGAWDFIHLALAFLLISFQDELIFRGYIYSTFRERFSWVHAAGLTNLLAVALYAGHPEIGSVALLNVFLLGLALAAMREKTGSLWMPTLFAGAWNVILGCVLSLPISGSLYPRLFNHKLEGSEGVTGGAYGPEGSWVLSGLLLVLVAVSAVWTDRRSLTELSSDLSNSSNSSDSTPG